MPGMMSYQLQYSVIEYQGALIARHISEASSGKGHRIPRFPKLSD